MNSILKNWLNKCYPAVCDKFPGSIFYLHEDQLTRQYKLQRMIGGKRIVVNIDKPTILKANIFKYIGKIEKPNQKICELISNNIKIKILFRVELRL